MCCRNRLVTTAASIRSSDSAPSPIHAVWYLLTNGTRVENQPIVTYGSSTAVTMCTARNATARSEALRCRPATAKRGKPGSGRPPRVRTPRTITTVRRTSETTPVPLLRYQRALPVLIVGLLRPAGKQGEVAVVVDETGGQP